MADQTIAGSFGDTSFRNFQAPPENNNVGDVQAIDLGVAGADVFPRAGNRISVHSRIENNQYGLVGYLMPSTGTGVFVPDVQNIPLIAPEVFIPIAYGGGKSEIDYVEGVQNAGGQAEIDYVEGVQLIGEDVYELANFNEIHREEAIRLIGKDLYELIN